MAFCEAEITRIEATLTPRQKAKLVDMRSKIEQRHEEHQGAEQVRPPPAMGHLAPDAAVLSLQP